MSPWKPQGHRLWNRHFWVAALCNWGQKDFFRTRVLTFLVFTICIRIRLQIVDPNYSALFNIRLFRRFSLCVHPQSMHHDRYSVGHSIDVFSLNAMQIQVFKKRKQWLTRFWLLSKYTYVWKGWRLELEIQSFRKHSLLINICHFDVNQWLIIQIWSNDGWKLHLFRLRGKFYF